MLDYIKSNTLVHGRNYRVSEDERKVFDALKVITEAGWVIHDES